MALLHSLLTYCTISTIWSMPMGNVFIPAQRTQHWVALHHLCCQSFSNHRHDARGPSWKAFWRFYLHSFTCFLHSFVVVDLQLQVSAKGCWFGSGATILTLCKRSFIPTKLLFQGGPFFGIPKGHNFWLVVLGRCWLFQGEANRSWIFSCLIDVVGDHGQEDHAPKEDVIFFNHSFFSIWESIDSIFSSSPWPDWAWTVWLTRHLVVTQDTSASAIWATDDGVDLVLQCSSDQRCIGSNFSWKVMMWTSFDVNLQQSGGFTSLLMPCTGKSKTRVLSCIRFLVLRFTGKVDHEVGSSANMDFISCGRRRRTGCVSTSFFIHSTSSLNVLSSTFPRVAVCSNSSISSRVVDLAIWGQPPLTWIGKMPRCGWRRQTPSLFHSILQPSFSMSKPIGKIGSASALSGTITPPGVIRSWACWPFARVTGTVLYPAKGSTGRSGRSAWVAPESTRPCDFRKETWLNLNTFNFSEFSCWSRSTTSSLGSFAELVVDEVADADVVRLFNILFACSKKSFIEACSELPSSSLAFELDGDFSSPSTFCIRGLCGEVSFEFFGLVHAGDIWSGQPQFQHLPFFIFDIMGKVACLSPSATLVCEEKTSFRLFVLSIFSFCRWPSSLFFAFLCFWLLCFQRLQLRLFTLGSGRGCSWLLLSQSQLFKFSKKVVCKLLHIYIIWCSVHTKPRPD